MESTAELFFLGPEAIRVGQGLIRHHYKIINSCEITPKTGAGACVHSEIKCDIEQKSCSEVN